MRFADSMAVPTGWLWPAGLMIAIAIVMLLVPAPAAKRLAEESRWRTGTLGDDGIVQFADGSLGQARDTGLPIGPVISFDPPDQRGG